MGCRGLGVAVENVIFFLVFGSWEVVLRPAMTHTQGATSCLLPTRFGEELGGEKWIPGSAGGS